MSKTIQEMADEYIGHPKEIDEYSCITAQRESFKQGAYKVLEEIEKARKLGSTSRVSLLLISERIKQLKGK